MAGATTPPPDNLPWVRRGVVLFASALLAISLYGLVRYFAGLAPPNTHPSLAVAVHLATVLPAIPIGAYILFVRKGGPRHRWLGRIWLGLMFATAITTIFIRDINHGQFSYIHLFTLLAFLSVPRVWLAARRRDFTAHRKAVLGFYIGALLIAGFFTFIPGRTMWQWAFG